MNKKISKWLSFAALLMFVAATFQIANESFFSGIVLFGAAACFASTAGVYRKREKEERQERVDNK